MKVRPITTLLCSLLPLAGLIASPQDRGPLAKVGSGRRYALIIGNNAYPWRPLRNAVNDAEDLAAKLPLVGFSPEDITLVTDANLLSMRKASVEFLEKLTVGDVAFFYYSGHGLEVHGENYLIPVDFPSDAAEAEARQRAFSAQEFVRDLEASPASIHIIILDACRDNPLRSSRSASGGLAGMPLQGRGTLIALAAAPGRTADDNPSGGNGLFTSHLLRALPTPGITLEELMRQVAREVYRDSAGRQTPELYTSVGEDFELVPRNAHQLDEKFAVMKVFYATDRIKTKEGRFGADPASNDGFTMGLAQVSIPHDHRMGEIEQPTWIRFEFKQDPTEHVVVITMTDQSKAQFYSGLRSVVATSKEKQVLVFIHGFNVGFEDALRRTAQIAYDLKFDGAPVLYSWPSKGVLSPLAYVQDQRNADLSSYHLASFLRELRASSGADSITLIAHSMGNRLLASALNQIFNDKEFAPTTAFRHVALMAPDIDAEQFKRLAEAIKSTAGDITLYCSSRDEALRAAAEYAGYPRAGQGVLIIPGIYTIDASDVDTSLLGAFHQYYADNGAIISDLYYLIRGNSPDQRARLRVRRLGASIYWHFDPASR